MLLLATRQHLVSIQDRVIAAGVVKDAGPGRHEPRPNVLAPCLHQFLLFWSVRQRVLSELEQVRPEMSLGAKWEQMGQTLCLLTDHVDKQSHPQM